jgi:NAD(P) transhydrogenase subunit alpha
MSVTIGALRESAPRETRVSLVPEVTDKLVKDGARVLIERAAGERAGFPDSTYKSVVWAASASEVLQGADVVLTVQPLSLEQIAQLRASAVVVGFMQPYARTAEVRALKERSVTSFAMELVPRISRAQSMDALSSQAAIAGYKASAPRRCSSSVRGWRACRRSLPRDVSAPWSKPTTCAARRASRCARSERSSSTPA